MSVQESVKIAVLKDLVTWVAKNSIEPITKEEEGRFMYNMDLLFKLEDDRPAKILISELITTVVTLVTQAVRIDPEELINALDHMEIDLPEEDQ